MKTLLIVTDFSEIANHAVDYACNLVNKLGIENLYLVNTYENIPIYDSGEAGSLALGMQQAEEIEQTRKEAFQLLLRNLKPRLHQAVKLFPLILNESLPEAVNRTCMEANVDLVIMGIKPRDDFENLLVGSPVQQAVDKIHFPVLLLPRNAPITIPEKVVLATNLNEPLSTPMLLKLHKFLHRFNARVFALHKSLRTPLSERQSQLASDLELHLQNYQCQLHILEAGQDLPSCINQFANDNNATLIICMHKMRGFLAGLFHKSSSKALAWNSKIPLLVLHIP